MNMPINKKTILLIAGLIAAVAAHPLGISEAELTAEIEMILLVILGAGGASAVAAPVAKQRITKAKDETPERLKSVEQEHNDRKNGVSKNAPRLISQKDRNHGTRKFSEPIWNNDHSWFATNLQTNPNEGEKPKAYIPHNINCLWIRIRGAEAMSIQFFSPANQLLQLEMSSEFDEDNDSETARIELFDPLGTRFPPGIYKVRVRAPIVRKGIGGESNDEGLLEFKLV